MLNPKLAHVSVLRAVDPRAVGEAERRTARFEYVNGSVNAVLLVVIKLKPPGAKLVSEFDNQSIT